MTFPLHLLHTLAALYASCHAVQQQKISTPVCSSQTPLKILRFFLYCPRPGDLGTASLMFATWCPLKGSLGDSVLLSFLHKLATNTIARDSQSSQNQLEKRSTTAQQEIVTLWFNFNSCTSGRVETVVRLSNDSCVSDSLNLSANGLTFFFLLSFPFPLHCRASYWQQQKHRSWRRSRCQ